MHTPKNHHKVLHLSQFAHQGVLRVYPVTVTLHCVSCGEPHIPLVALEYDRSYDQTLVWRGFRPKARDPTLL